MYECIFSQWLPILVFACTRLAASTPLTVKEEVPSSFPAISPFISIPSRTQLSQVDIPEDFTIYPRFAASGSPPESYFYNAIIALKDVALGDYEQIMPIQRTATRRFPQPVIQFYGIGAGMPRKYLVWGLVMSVWNMLYTSNFKDALVLLYDRGREVGGILYGPQEIQNRLLSQRKGDPVTTRKLLSTLSISSNSTGGSQFNQNNITSTPLMTNRVAVLINPFGDPIPANNIYMTIISVLSEAAVHPSTDRIQEAFTSHFDAIDCYF
ncbi:MAG: hypothetical protein Q9169_005489, partial [Polycauliona sp. 2 TL-2023]